MTILERRVDEPTTELAAAMDREMRATSRQRVAANLTIAGKRGLVIGLIIGVFAIVAPVTLSTRVVLFLWAGLTLVIAALQSGNPPPGDVPSGSDRDGRIGRGESGGQCSVCVFRLWRRC